MKQYKKELSTNLIKVTTPDDLGRGKEGLLGELQDPALFTARNGATYNPPAAAPPESLRSSEPLLLTNMGFRWRAGAPTPSG